MVPEHGAAWVEVVIADPGAVDVHLEPAQGGGVQFCVDDVFVLCVEFGA